MRFKEIETKYRADGISLVEFTEFCRGFAPVQEFVSASGWDYFYASADQEGSFARHRIGPDINQLTFKRKTTERNNFVRTEHNINLARGVKTDQVAALCAEFGYEFRKSIYKNVFIYFYDRYNFVYYICYDENMKELGRFIEIEMSEEHPWGSEQEAWDTLVRIEESSKPLGLTPQKRVKNSLFEQFCR